MERIEHQNEPKWNELNTKMNRNGTHRTPEWTEIERTEHRDGPKLSITTKLSNTIKLSIITSMTEFFQVINR